ncbi:DUF4817 domain-containing protein [Trichonephila clavipes]|nr:DUF4817 domain-containing protein [Trichonephila clavipes]
MGRGNFVNMFFKHVPVMFVGKGRWKGWNGVFVLPTVSVSNMLWCAFALEVYFSKGRSVIAVQRAFHCHFLVSSRGHVPDRKCVLMWMDTFRVTGNVSKEGKGPLKIFRTPENVERVCVLIQTGM